MYLWESDIQESVVFKPVEIRGKRGRKKLKKSNAAIYIPNMDADNFEKICNENGLKFVYVEVPPHGDSIDRAVLWVEINKICDRRDAGIISDLTCLQQLLSSVRHAPTIIPASGD